MQWTEEKNNLLTAQKTLIPESALLEIERVFNVPAGQLFQAFKTSDALKIWWWPYGIYADRIDLDFREGGKYFINMKGIEGKGGGMTGEFEEIVENKRISMTDHFADQNGNVISAEQAQMPGIWPEVININLEFESLDNDKCCLHLSQNGIPNEMRKDCIQGWSEAFDKLEKYLGDYSKI